MSAEVTTSKPIDLDQLVVELGTWGLIANTSDGVTVIRCDDSDITQAQLEAAVEAHEPKSPPASAATRLQAQVDELTDLTLEMLDLLMGM